MVRKATSPHKLVHLMPLRRSSRLSGGLDSSPSLPLPSSPRSRQFATLEQQVEYAMANDTWSIDTQNGFDDQEDPPPRQARLETGNPHAPREVRILL